MINGGLNGGLIIGAILISLAAAFLILVVIVGPETGGIGSLIFAYIGIAATFGSIAALYGKDKLDEFYDCIGEIIGVHLVVDSVIHAAESLLNGILKKVIHGIDSIVHIYQFGKCISNLSK